MTHLRVTIGEGAILDVVEERGNLLVVSLDIDVAIFIQSEIVMYLTEWNYNLDYIKDSHRTGLLKKQSQRSE